MHERDPMSLMQMAQWLEHSALGTAIRESNYLFPNLESLHVLAITLVVGTIAFIDLRLLDVASRSQPIRHLTEQILPWTWGAFACAVASGLLLFTAHAAMYLENTPFRLKMLLLMAAGCNMLLFHLITYRGVQHWDADAPTPAAAKAAGALSLAMWMGIIGLGRWIGFT